MTIGRSFAVGRFATTRGEFATFVKETGHDAGEGCSAWTGLEWKHQSDKSWRSPGFVQDDRHPVVCVNWVDAKAYAAWVSRKSRTTPFWWGSSITPKQANYDGSGDPYMRFGSSKGEYRKRTGVVDSFEANPWGLYNVHGNVWDWTEDCWNANFRGAPTDGSAWTSGDCSKRVAHGGSWGVLSPFLRSASRARLEAVVRGNDRGFRVARTLIP